MTRPFGMLLGAVLTRTLLATVTTRHRPADMILRTLWPLDSDATEPS